MDEMFEKWYMIIMTYAFVIEKEKGEIFLLKENKINRSTLPKKQ